MTAMKKCFDCKTETGDLVKESIYAIRKRDLYIVAQGLRSWMLAAGISLDEAEKRILAVLKREVGIDPELIEETHETFCALLELFLKK